MKFRIQSINFDATEKLEAYINKKAMKLSKVFDEIMTMDVYLKVVKPETATNKEAERRRPKHESNRYRAPHRRAGPGGDPQGDPPHPAHPPR